MKKLIFFAMMLLIVMASCERKSRQLSAKDKEPTIAIENINFEKVIILDSIPVLERKGDLFMYRYKVKRPEKGVVDYIREAGLYKRYDTIFVYKEQFE